MHRQNTELSVNINNCTRRVYYELNIPWHSSLAQSELGLHATFQGSARIASTLVDRLQAKMRPRNEPGNEVGYAAWDSVLLATPLDPFPGRRGPTQF